MNGSARPQTGWAAPRTALYRRSCVTRDILPWRISPGAGDVAAKRLRDALVAEADAQDRQPAGEPAGSARRCMPASLGVQGPGETRRCALRRQGSHFVERDRVVANHFDLLGPSSGEVLGRGYR